MHILMIAAENGALPGGKVGGIGDVIRDVPRALAAAGHQVTVITPGYQSLSKLPNAQLVNNLTLDFCSSLEQVGLFTVIEAEPVAGVEHWLVEHPVFASCGEGEIYCDDDKGPFATDAHKFALFCHAVCRAIITEALPKPDLLHLHDWHAALVLFLRKNVATYQSLLSIPTVFTIHNLSIQGVRPFHSNSSSLQTWFPSQEYCVEEIRDPHTESCVNMMKMGINLADKVHVVSPEYSKEILKASDVALGFIGGEGLEVDLQKIAEQNKLVGILNGCEYTHFYKQQKTHNAVTKSDFIALANDGLLDWVGDESYISTAYFFAQQRLMSWSKKRSHNQPVVASIGRLTAQKVSLFQTEITPGVTSLDALLNVLGKGMYIMIGSGDRQYENFMSRTMSKHDNFIFLKGYSDTLSRALYSFCDMFLMPSSFEPCGISQMLAMREGKPCLVHKVGGLADTVKHKINGFSFSGVGMKAQAEQMLEAFEDMLVLKNNEPVQWQSICQAAKASRFSWSESVKAYEAKLYSIVND